MDNGFVRDPARRTNTGTALAVTTAALMVVGVVMVATATVGPDRSLFRDGMGSSPFGRQLIFALTGALVIAGTARFAGPLLASRTWRNRTAVVVFGLSLLALALTWASSLADPHRGSHRWLDLTSLGLNAGVQPSEFAKPALVLFLSAWLTRFDPRSFTRGLLPAAGAIGLCVAMVGTEDFGTAALIAGTSAAMLVAAGCRWRYLLGMGCAGLAGMVGLILAEPYRLERITGYQNIWTDTQGAAYQPFQSLVTIASGGWLGRGLGAGVQKHGYLPEAHTDFIFAVVCEETGFVGALLVVGLFVCLGWSGLAVMRGARGSFPRLLAFGLTTLLLLQALMNMAVVTVLTPTTGIPLPFVSAGGSGLISACLSVGLLCAVARANDDPAQPLVDPSPSYERPPDSLLPASERSAW